MDSENKFWIALWGIIVAGVITAVLLVIADDAYTSYKLGQMVARGVNPLEARCAFYGGSSASPFDCNLFIVKH